MTALAKPLRTASGLRDMRRDWRRWSAVERCSAVTLLATLAVMAAMLVAASTV